MKPPKHVWHVSYILRHPNGDHITNERIYSRSDYAANRVRDCEKYPDYLRLIGVHRGECKWEPVEL